MTDKEKKAIELLKQPPDFSLSYYKRENAIDTILNLIEKQSKEIEELKKPKYVINCETNEITKLTNDFVSKDKIKAKIEEVKDGTYDAKIVLQSLLEDRLNDGITKIPDYDITSVVDAYLKLLNYKKGE